MSTKTSADKRRMFKHARSVETVPETEPRKGKKEFNFISLNDVIEELPEKEMLRSSKGEQSLGSTPHQSFKAYQSLYSPVSDKLKEKIDKWDNYVQYFLSYSVDWDSHEKLIENYLKHGSNILQWIELESKVENDTTKRSTKVKTSTFASKAERKSMDDIKMALLQRLPPTDRSHFPISGIIDLIPRLLFTNNNFKVDTSSTIKDDFSSSCVYIPSVNEYAYIVGKLIYDDIASSHNTFESEDDFMLNKEDKYNEPNKLKPSKLTFGSRGDTMSTSDNSTFKSNNTFKSNYTMQLKGKSGTAVSPAGKENSMSSSKINQLTSILDQINEDEDDNSEEEIKSEIEGISDINDDDLTLKKEDSLRGIKHNRNSYKRSGSSIVMRKSRVRINFPKLLVLVSKYPIYDQMKEFLEVIRNNCSDYSSVQLERIIANLVYEFPHPGEKFIIKSNFWSRNKRNQYFKYETIYSLPYVESKYYLRLSRYRDKINKIWSLISRVLYGWSILMVSENNSKLMAWSEILRSIIFPFNYPGLIISRMLRPDLMLLASDQPYIVGLNVDTYKYCQFYLPNSVVIFNIDNNEIKYSKKQFIQATDSNILNSNNKARNRYEFPQWLIANKQKDLEALLSDVPGSNKSTSQMRKYATNIRQFFLQFFLVDLLDYKKWDYTQEEIFLSHKRQKEMRPEHYRFIKDFSKTQTFKNFQQMIK